MNKTKKQPFQIFKNKLIIGSTIFLVTLAGSLTYKHITISSNLESNLSTFLTSDYLNTHFDRGVAHYKLGDYQGAIEDYTQAIHLNPNYANAYYARGLNHYRLENNQAAIEDFKKARELGNSKAIILLKEIKSFY